MGTCANEKDKKKNNPSAFWNIVETKGELFGIARNLGLVQDFGAEDV